MNILVTSNIVCCITSIIIIINIFITINIIIFFYDVRSAIVLLVLICVEIGIFI